MKIDNSTIQKIWKEREQNLTPKTDYLKFKSGFLACAEMIDQSDKRQCLINYLNDEESYLTEKRYKDVVGWALRNGIRIEAQTICTLEDYNSEKPTGGKLLRIRIKDIKS